MREVVAGDRVVLTMIDKRSLVLDNNNSQPANIIEPPVDALREVYILVYVVTVTLYVTSATLTWVCPLARSRGRMHCCHTY